MMKNKGGGNVNQNIFNRKTKGTLKKNFNDDESSGSDVRILREEEVVEEMNLKEFNRMKRRKRRESVYKGRNNDTGTRSDVKILNE